MEDLIGGLPDIDKGKIREILKEAPIVPFDLLKELRLDPLKKLPFGLPCRSIYANCGTWVNGEEPCTYVETQEDFKHGRHYVRLRSYHPKKELLQEAYIKLNQ